MTVSLVRHAVGTELAGASPTASASIGGAGSLVSVAGQLGTDEQGQLPAGSTAADQVRRAFANIDRILGRLDLGLLDVLRFNTYVVGRPNVAVFQAVRDSLFADVYVGGVYPPNTLVIVAGLFDERCVVEIEALAVRPAGDGDVR